MTPPNMHYTLEELFVAAWVGTANLQHLLCKYIEFFFVFPKKIWYVLEIAFDFMLYTQFEFCASSGFARSNGFFIPTNYVPLQ
jgi:hypothetical protein